MTQLDELCKQIKACSKCTLRETATQPVPPLGEVGAKYMLVGEAPGQNEDREGIPFVGLAGQRLNKLLALAGIDPNKCYLTNTVKCRPPSNRQPRKGEIRECLRWLKEEIALVKPEYIITLGAVPLSLFCPHSVSQMHGCLFTFDTDTGESSR